MDTFECYCRNKAAITTINEAAAAVLRQALQPCDSPTPSRPGCRVVVPRQPHDSFAHCKGDILLQICKFGRTGLQNKLNEGEKLDYRWLIIIQTYNPLLECFDILSSSIDAPTLDIHRLH